MKKHYTSRIKTAATALLIAVFTFAANSQPIVTTFANNNGFSCVTFNFKNNNAYDVIITDIGGVTGTSGANTASIWYKPTAINGSPGNISVANGWTQNASQPFTGVSNITTTVSQTMLTGLSLIIPSGATYGMAFTCTDLRYSTLTAGTFTVSSGGCDLITGANIGYGGDFPPTTPPNTPRGFIGSINFIAAVPCVGVPNPGNVIGSASVCSGVNFALSLQNSLSGSGNTYQWQSSNDGVSYSNIIGATNSNYNASQTTATYYQCVVICTTGPDTATATPLLVGMNPFYNCYCASSATTVADEEIFGVAISTLNNSSTCNTTGSAGSILNQYSNYTNLPPTDLAKTLNYTFTVQIGTCGGNFTSGTSIFIDYNQNGSFADAGEQVFTTAVGTNGPHTVTGSILIPASAGNGITRMRVINAEGFTGTGITPCLSYGYGETEDYLVNIVPLPSTPPTPLQDVATPSCTSGTDLTVMGTPGNNEAWYWQTTANGTSLANPVSGAYTVFLNGTYFVRAYSTQYLVWSQNSSSVTVSNIPLAPNPPTPSAAANPACLATTISVAAPTDPNVTYYWQGTTVNGASTADNAATPYAVNASGTYHVSAYDASSSCWSNTSSIAVNINTFVPQVPTSLGNVTICQGVSTATIAATVPQSGTQSNSFGTNLQSPGTPVNFTINIPALPAGATIVSSVLQINDATAIGGSYQSEIRVALSGIATLAPTQISTVTGAGTVTPNPYIINLSPLPLAGGSVTLTLTETFDDAGTDATFSNIQIITTYTLPATTVTWYDASVLGNSQGNGSSLQAVGTPLLPTTNTPGTYTYYAEAMSGACPSATRATVNLVINPSPQYVLNDTAICAGGAITLNAQNAGSSYLWNTSETTQSIQVATGGNYAVNITNAFNCSINNSMTLVLNQSYTTNQTITLCSGQAIIVGNNIYDATGVYIDVFTAQTGCDSTLVTDLTVLPTSSTNQTFVYCGQGSVTVGNNVYTSTGVYTDILVNSVGCDSTVVTDLTVNPIDNITQNFAFCSGGSVTVGNSTYNQTGIYTDILTNTSGCDSIVTTNLVVFPVTVTSNTVSLCVGDVYTVGSNTYTTTGVYTDNFTSIFGCDSTIISNLTFNNLPTVTFALTDTVCIQASPFILTGGTPTGGVYTGQGVTNGTFSPVAAGLGSHIITYTFIVGATGCANTATQSILVSACTGIEENSIANSLNIYPNPSTGMFTIAVGNANFAQLQINVTDIQGKIVYNESAKNTGTEFKKQLNLEGLNNGVYFIKLTTDKEVVTQRLIIQ